MFFIFSFDMYLAIWTITSTLINVEIRFIFPIRFNCVCTIVKWTTNVHSRFIHHMFLIQVWWTVNIALALYN